MSRVRLDAALVRRGLAASRAAARRAIADRQVTVGGLPASKAATLVGPSDEVALLDDTEPWASRAGLKLAGALERFDVAPPGKRCLDVGASTGGFTDVLLRGGAEAVTALDVGYGQLLTRLARDRRVTVVDRTNFRTLDVDVLDPPFDLVTVDVSFISVSLLAPNLAGAGAAGTDYVVLVKPQFEAGREAVGRGGLVRDPQEWARALGSVAATLFEHGIGFVGTAPSAPAGATGNREFFLHGRLGRPDPPDRVAIEAVTGA